MPGDRFPWVEAIAKMAEDWLLGRVVEVEETKKGESNIEDHNFIDAVRGLSASGLFNEQPDFADIRFIDYHDQPNTERQAIMGGDYRFSYRVRFVRKLNGQTGEWAYLRSSWTEWSPYVLPVPPVLSALDSSEAVVSQRERIVPPRVVFKFTSKQVNTLVEGLHALRPKMHGEFEYRLLLARQVPKMIKASDGSDEFDWIEIDGPKLMSPGAGDGSLPPVELVDDGFEREALQKGMELHYRLFVEQIVRLEDEEGQTSENPIRSLEGGERQFTITVPKPIMTGGSFEEVEVQRTINVR